MLTSVALHVSVLTFVACGYRVCVLQRSSTVIRSIKNKAVREALAAELAPLEARLGAHFSALYDKLSLVAGTSDAKADAVLLLVRQLGAKTCSREDLEAGLARIESDK